MIWARGVILELGRRASGVIPVSSHRVALGVIAVMLVVGCAKQSVQSPPGAVGTPPSASETPGDTSQTPGTETGTQPPPDPILTQAVADTTAAGQKLRSCAGRKLLAEEEATVDATLEQLRQARAAFAQGNIQLAASRARSAKQLSASLRCR